MTMVVLASFVALLTDRRVIAATTRHDAGRVWLALRTPVGVVTAVVAVVLGRSPRGSSYRLATCFPILSGPM